MQITKSQLKPNNWHIYNNSTRKIKEKVMTKTSGKGTQGLIPEINGQLILSLVNHSKAFQNVFQEERLGLLFIIENPNSFEPFHNQDLNCWKYTPTSANQSAELVETLVNFSKADCDVVLMLGISNLAGELLAKTILKVPNFAETVGFIQIFFRDGQIAEFESNIGAFISEEYQRVIDKLEDVFAALFTALKQESPIGKLTFQ